MVSAHPLQGAFDRIDRAEKHLAEFKIEQRAFDEINHDAVTIKFKQEPPHQPYAQLPGISPPSLAAIILGEIVYNLRAALDYLVFELALRDSGSIQHGTQFPICDTKKAFDAVSVKFLVGLNSDHRAAIEALQPYDGCDWTGPLRDISNPDKHRQLVAEERPSFAINISTMPKPDMPGIYAPRLRSVRRTVRPTGEEVDMHLATTFPIMVKINVAPGSPFLAPVVELIEDVKAGVHGTLEAFKPEFQ